MSIINTSSFQSDLLPIVKKWFGDEYKDYASLYDKIVAVESMDQAYDVDALVSGMGLLQKKNQGSSLTFDDSKQTFTPRYTALTYALGFNITKEMMADGIAFKNAKKFTEMLKRSSMQTKEIVAHQLINQAYNGAAVMDGGDGQPLGSASHVTRSGLQSNILAVAADLSEAAIEQLSIQIKNAVDDRGLRIKLMPQKLVINTALEPEANRITKSDLRVGTTDNDLNYIKTTNMFPGGIIVSPYLTSTIQWGVVTDCPDGLKLKIRQDAEIDSSNDFNTKNGMFSVDMRLVAGFSDFRGYYSTPGV